MLSTAFVSNTQPGNCSCHVVRHIPRTCLSSPWESVPSNPLHPGPSPLGTTVGSLKSVSSSVCFSSIIDLQDGASSCYTTWRFRYFCAFHNGHHNKSNSNLSPKILCRYRLCSPYRVFQYPQLTYFATGSTS